MSEIRLQLVTSQQECERCFDAMRLLRPDLSDVDTFTEQVIRQMALGYRLLAAWLQHDVVGLAGYRLSENLMYGRFVYIDDLVVIDTQRREGLGARLIDTVRDKARALNCRHLVLDTGLGMALAQRFYFRQGLLSRGMHFAQPLEIQETNP